MKRIIMPDQKKFASYALITIGSAGLIANTIAFKYCSNLSPLIAGGMIGSMIPLFGCAVIGVLLLMDRILLRACPETGKLKHIPSLT